MSPSYSQSVPVTHDEHLTTPQAFSGIALVLPFLLSDDITLYSCFLIWLVLLAWLFYSLLPPVERVNGRRSYDVAHGQRLTLIRSARAAGFSLREIARFLDGFSPATTASDRWQVLVAAKLIETEQELIDLQQRRQRLRSLQACLCVGVDECAERLSA